METVLKAFSDALRSAPEVALGAAFLWGILSVVLSPCHLASIPLIVGFIDDQGRVSTRRAFGLSTLFAAGILVTIAAVGVITYSASRMIGDIGPVGNYVVAGIFFLVGLHLLGVIPMPWSGRGPVGMERKGFLAALLLGLLFGIALGPCTFAYMALPIGVAFKMGSAAGADGAGSISLYGALLLAVYGLGHCSVIVAAGTSTGLVQRALNWNERSKGAVALKKACGVLVLLGGLYLIYTAQ